MYKSRDVAMPTETTYTHARANLAALCHEAAASREPIIIHRRGAEDVALVDAAELRSLIETAHLLRSPKNAQRLITALIRARDRDLAAESTEALREEFGLGQTS
jgi:antitoxin YefM